MGNALGIKAPEEPEEDDGDENYDAKAGSQFKVTYFLASMKFQGLISRFSELEIIIFSGAYESGRATRSYTFFENKNDQATA